MHYKAAYLHLFNRLTDLVALLDSLDSTTEWVDTRPLLQAIQREAEEICIAD